MIERSKLQTGLLLWWGFRMVTDQCLLPCIVTDLRQENGKIFIKLMNCHTFTTSDWMDYEKVAISYELRLCTQEEAKDYISKHIDLVYQKNELQKTLRKPNYKAIRQNEEIINRGEEICLDLIMSDEFDENYIKLDLSAKSVLQA